MGSEWLEVAVEEIAAPERNSLVGGPFGSNLVSSDYVLVGVPVIRGQNMGFGRWVDGEFAFVSESKAKELSPNTARPGDIVFTQRGTLGQVALVRDDKFSRYIVSQSQMKLTPDPIKTDSMFLYYLFTSDHQQSYMKSNSIQTGVPHTNLGVLKKTPLSLPPLETQRQIASILSAFDDKIELNRRMNRTLEAMARALFKSWFVDFDPTRAKMRGEQPAGMDAQTAALFPDALLEVDGREVPKGWKVGQAGEIMTNPRRTVDPKNLDPNTPYIGLEHMPRGTIQLDNWGKAEDVESGKVAFRRDEILFGKLRPYFKKVGIAPVNGISSTDILVIKPNLGWNGYTLFLVSSDEFIDAMTGSSSGTRMPRASWSDLENYPIIIPPEELSEVFTKAISSTIDKLRASIGESAHLEQLRDALLPRLLSGELEVTGWVEGLLEGVA